MDTQTVSAYLCIKDAARAIEFYKQAFAATELYRLTEPGGTRIGHAEIRIGNTVVMLSDEYPEWGALSPQSIGGCPVRLSIEVPDPDAAVRRAADAGAAVTRPVKDEFYGHRAGLVTDPFGYSWFLTAVVEQVSPEEMQRRWDAMV